MYCSEFNRFSLELLYVDTLCMRMLLSKANLFNLNENWDCNLDSRGKENKGDFCDHLASPALIPLKLEHITLKHFIGLMLKIKSNVYYINRKPYNGTQITCIRWNVTTIQEIHINNINVNIHTYQIIRKTVHAAKASKLLYCRAGILKLAKKLKAKEQKNREIGR